MHQVKAVRHKSGSCCVARPYFHICKLLLCDDLFRKFDEAIFALQPTNSTLITHSLRKEIQNAERPATQVKRIPAILNFQLIEELERLRLVQIGLGQ